MKSASGLTLGQLANVQTVGMGLYLALGIVQAISATGIAALSRRVTTLRNAVTNARIRDEIASVRSLSGQVSGLEIGFHHLNRFLLGLVFFLFLASLIFFTICSLRQKILVSHIIEISIYVYYLLVPTCIFIISALIIRSRCSNISKKVDEAQKRIQTALIHR